MAKKKQGFLPKLGSWSFIVGVVLAIVSGFFTLTPGIASVMVLLGIIVGFLNVRGEHAMTFLLASVSLVVISSLGGSAFSGVAVIGATLQKMLSNMIIFVIPAAIIVALRAVLTIAYNE